MAADFNPYHVWLGIPPEEQPANHYRLLGIRLFESSGNVIDNAADRQMAHLRTIQVGKHGDLSQRLLNEVAAARVCLLDPKKRAVYDRQLRAKLPATAPVASASLPAAALPVAAALPQPVDQSNQWDDLLGSSNVKKSPAGAASKSAKSAAAKRDANNRNLTIGIGLAVALVAVVGIGIFLLSGGPTDGTIAFDWPANDRSDTILSVDGVPQAIPASGPWEYHYPAGSHHIVAEHLAYKLDMHVDVVAGERKAVPADWKPKAMLVLNWPLALRSGAELRIDGRIQTISQHEPLEIAVEPGRRMILITRSGFSPIRTTATVAADGRELVSIAAPPTTAKLVFDWPADKRKNAELIVDGQSQAVAADSDSAPFELTLPPGQHVVHITRTGFEPFNQAIELSAGTDGTIKPTWTPEKKAAPTVAETTVPVEATAPQPVKKLPIPTAAEQEKIAKQLNELYKTSQPGPKDPAKAQELYDVATKDGSSPAERYMLLIKGAEIAAAAGDLNLSLSGIDTLDADYEIDALDLKQKLLEKFIAAGKPDQVAIAIPTAEELSDQAVAADRFDIAVVLSTSASKAVAKSKIAAHKEVEERLARRRHDIRFLDPIYAAAKKAQETLEKTPADPEANLTVGRWLCFYKGDWTTGLPMLAKGSDEKLKSLAEQEIKAPAEADQQVQLADAWWDLAQKEAGIARDSLHLHAGNIYQDAMPNLASALKKAAIEKRLTEIADVPSSRPAVAPTSSAAVVVRIEPGDGTAAFNFRSIESPSNRDYADASQHHATIRLLRGSLAEKSGSADVLLDGHAQSAPDAPGESCIVNDNGSGLFLLDLGDVVSVRKVNTYSWHPAERAAQNYYLYGSDETSPPGANGELVKNGWRLVAHVDTDKFFGIALGRARPPQQAVSISSTSGRIGSYRYLLWDVRPTRSDHRPVELNSLFGEFDVYASPAHERVASVPAASLLPATAIENHHNSVKIPLNQWIDVVPLIDPERDRVKGVWTRKGAELICESKKNGRICFPVTVDGGYDLAVEFTRTQGNGNVATMLSIGSHSCAATLSGWDGAVSGLMRLNGNDPDNSSNPIAVRPGMLENGHRYRLVSSVRIISGNRASIDLSLDGKPYLPHWEGNPAALSDNPYWGLGTPRRLGIGSQNSDVIFHSVRLRIVSGNASLDPAIAESAAPQNVPAEVDKFSVANWIDILGRADTTRDVVKGNWSRKGKQLNCEAGELSRIALPVTMNGSYDFEVEFTRTSGDGDVGAMLSVASNPCLITLSSYKGAVSGIANVDGGDASVVENPTTVRPGKIENGQRHTLLASIRILSSDRASIDVSLDGKPYLPHWEGNPAALSLSPIWSMPNPKQLGLAAYLSDVTFHSARLRTAMAHVSLDTPIAPQSAPALATSEKATIAQAFPHGQWIDVLGTVDTAKNALQGTWSRSGSEITCDAQDQTKIEIPVVVSGSYELETEFTRTAGDGDVNTIFPVGSHQCLLQISADGGGSSGLNTVDGRNCQDHDNPTHVEPGTILSNHRYRLLIKVQIAQPDRASIDVALDGKRYLPHWEGNPQSLGLDLDRWTLPNFQEFGLGLYKDRVTFHSVRLRVGKGEAAPAAVAPAVVKTDRVGGGGGGPFVDIGPGGSLLVGMHVVHNGVINIVTPVFRTVKGDVSGHTYGSNGGTNEEAIAKPGYAVGEMVIKAGNSVDGFRLVFMRIRGRRLDPKDSYDSQWFGGQGGGGETKLGGDGNPVLGIFGANGTNIDAIGLIVELPPAATAGKSP